MQPLYGSSTVVRLYQSPAWYWPQKAEGILEIHNTHMYTIREINLH